MITSFREFEDAWGVDIRDKEIEDFPLWGVKQDLLLPLSFYLATAMGVERKKNDGNERGRWAEGS